MKRVFLAISIPADIKTEIIKQADRLNLPLKWIPEKNLHITLHFFGNIEETVMDGLIQKIRSVTQTFSPFTLQAKAIRIQSGKYQDMIWVVFKESSEFEKLARIICKSIGNNTIRKPLPHITLIRSKTKIESENLPLSLKSTLKISVTQVELWESKLRPGGAAYSSLESFSLNGENS